MSLYILYPTYIQKKIMKRQLTEKMMKMFQLNYLVATKVNKVDIPTRYKSVGDGIVYNEECDETRVKERKARYKRVGYKD